MTAPADKTRARALRLAARLKRAVQRDEALEAVERARREALRVQVEAALGRLFDDLEALGRESGVVEVQRTERDLRLQRRDSWVRVASAPRDDAPDHLLVEASGVHADLSGSLRPEIDRWVLHIVHPPAEGRSGTQRSLLLLEGGLEWLFEKAFGLAIEDEDEVPDPAPGGARSV